MSKRQKIIDSLVYSKPEERPDYLEKQAQERYELGKALYQYQYQQEAQAKLKAQKSPNDVYIGITGDQPPTELIKDNRPEAPQHDNIENIKHNNNIILLLKTQLNRLTA